MMIRLIFVALLLEVTSSSFLPEFKENESFDDKNMLQNRSFKQKDSDDDLDLILLDLKEDDMDLAGMSKIFQTNPEWLFEGDILLEDDVSRKVSTYARLWPNAIVPYKLDSTLSKAHLRAIKTSIEHWEEHTCLRFKDETDNNDLKIGFIYFTDNTAGCYSYVGKVNVRNGQPVNIGRGCQYPEVVIHEIGHAIGFYHEQSRSGRNQYVKILKKNIQSGKASNFGERRSKNFGVKYDYVSIMHYDSDSFAKQRYAMNTIQSIDPRYQYVMGRGKVLSFRDIKTAQMAYCTAKNAEKCQKDSNDICNSGFLDVDCKCKCPKGTDGEFCENGEEEPTALPCGQTITEEGTYKTPSYPKRLKPWADRSCYFVMTAPEAKRVEVFFEDFSILPKYYGGVCRSEFAEVRRKGSQMEGEFYCGNDLKGKTMTSTNNEFVILLNSRTSRVVGKGLKFNVKFVDPPATTVPTTSGTTETTGAPTTPKTTKDATTTTYKTTTDVTMTYKPTTGAPTTYKTTTDSKTTTFDPRFFVTCLSFKTFRMYTKQQIDIISKNYLKGNYPNNFSCDIKISLKKSTDVLKFEILDMDIEKDEWCNKDFLSVKEIDNPSVFMKSCGKISGKSRVFSNSTLHMQFKTNEKITSKGFWVRITAV